MGAEGSIRAIIAALLANLFIAVLKILASLITHSAAMLAEGIHSIADSGNQLLLWFGYRMSRRPADTRHPFGYGKETYFWSFIVALLLFSLGGLFSCFEGIRKLQSPHTLENTLWNLVLLFTAFGVEAFSWKVAVSSLSPELRSIPAFFRYVRDTKDPSLIIVIFEDSAALLGLIVAFFGISLAYVTGHGYWDAMASITIGALLILVAFIIARETRSLLLGEGLSPIQTEEVRRQVLTIPRIHSVNELRTLYIGPTTLVVGLTLHVEGETTAEQVGTIVNEVENRIRAILPDAKYIYVETTGHSINREK